MLSVRTRIALCLLVGVLLLANGAWLYPENVSFDERYTIEAERAEYPSVVSGDIEISRCGAKVPLSTECAVVRYLANGNTISTAGGPRQETVSAVPEEFYGYDRTYYTTPLDIYRVNATAVDGELVLRVENVSLAELNHAAAEDYANASEPVQRAVDEGSATMRYDPAPDGYFVEKNGTFYEVRPAASERYPTGWGWKHPPSRVLGTLRYGGWLLGLCLVWYAGVLVGWDRWKD